MKQKFPAEAGNLKEKGAGSAGKNELPAKMAAAAVRRPYEVTKAPVKRQPMFGTWTEKAFPQNPTHTMPVMRIVSGLRKRRPEHKGDGVVGRER